MVFLAFTCFAPSSYRSSSELLLIGSPGEKPHNPVALAKAVPRGAGCAAVLKIVKLLFLQCFIRERQRYPQAGVTWTHSSAQSCTQRPMFVICMFLLCIMPCSLDNCEINLMAELLCLLWQGKSSVYKRTVSVHGSIRADQMLSSPSNILF